MTERVEIHHIKHISGFNDKGEIYSRTMPIEWVGLTDEEREFLLHQALRFYDTNALLLSFIKTVEAKLKEKNHYA